MPSSDIYVQITATSKASERSRSVVVLVPRQNIENFRKSGERKTVSADYIFVPDVSLRQITLNSSVSVICGICTTIAENVVFLRRYSCGKFCKLFNISVTSG